MKIVLGLTFISILNSQIEVFHTLYLGMKYVVVLLFRAIKLL